MATPKPKAPKKGFNTFGNQPPKSPAGTPEGKANTSRIRDLASRKGSTREMNRQNVDIPKADFLREMSRSPDGRAEMAAMWSSMDRSQKEMIFELLVTDFKDPTGKSNLNIEGRGILEALKGIAPSPERAAVQAADANEGLAPGYGKRDVQPEYEENTGIEPSQPTRFPRQELPAGFDPRAKGLVDPNSDLGSSQISDKPGLRSEPLVEWVETPDGARKPVVSTDGRPSTVDFAQRKEQSRFDEKWNSQWEEWESGGKEGAMPRRQKVKPLNDLKAAGTLTSPQQIFDRRFMSWIGGKKASNVLTNTISKDDELFELYRMLVADKNKGYSLAPNAVFSSPREMAEVVLRNVSPEVLANAFNPAAASDIKSLANDLAGENALLSADGSPTKNKPRDIAELADKRGVPRSSVKTQQYAAEQVIAALERGIRQRFGDEWGIKSGNKVLGNGEINEPSVEERLPDSPVDDGLAEVPAALKEGTTQDPSRIPGIADTAARTEDTWQGPLPESDLTKNLATIDSAERGTRIMDRAEKAQADGPVSFGDQTYLGDRVVQPGTDLHGMMKEQLAEAGTPAPKTEKTNPKGKAEWSPSDQVPDPNRTKELVQGRDSSKREFAASRYNEFTDDSGKVNTRRSSRDVAAELQAKLQSGADDAEVAALREELRQAKILDSLVSPFGKKASPKVGTDDRPAVSTKGRKGEKAEPDPFAELADEMDAETTSISQIEKDLADARIAAGIDPVPTPEATTTPEATVTAEAPAVVPETAATPEVDPTVDRPIDPLESAATPLDDPEATAAKNADAAEAPEDAAAAQPDQEAATIPEATGTDKKAKGKFKIPYGRTAATLGGGALIGGGWGALRNEMFSDRELPVAMGDETARPGMEQMPVAEIEGMDETAMNPSPFRPTDTFGGVMSPAERIRIMQRMGALRPNPNTQTAQNWSS